MKRILWRCLRFLLGLSCLLLGLWLALPPLIYPISRNAVVNACLTPIQSSHPGRVTVAPPAFGTPVAFGDSLVRVEDPFASRRVLSGLQSDVLALQDRISVLEQEQTRIESLQEALSSNLAVHRDLAIKHLRWQINEADAEMQLANAQHEFHEDQLRDFEELAQTRSISNQQLRSERAERTAWASRVAKSKSELSRFRHSLEALERDVFLESGTSSPFTLTRSHELEFEKLQVQSELLLVRARKIHAEHQLRVEQEEYAARRLQEFQAPVSGVVWRRWVEKHQQVDEHSRLLELISPENIFIEAAVPRQHYDWIELGDEVEIRLHGHPFLVLPGRVTHKHGAGATVEDRRVAGSLAEITDYEFRVYIQLDRPPPGATAQNFYHTGRRVYARFKPGRWLRWWK